MSMKKRENVRMRRVSAFFKIFCIILCAASVLSACAEKKPVEPSSESTTVTESFKSVRLKAPYSAADSLNPYFCTTAVNMSLTSLCYSGLFRLNEKAEAEPCVASAYSRGQDGIKVTLPAGGAFSDGSALTGADVVYSFEKAKASAAYSAEVAGIAAAKAESPLEVVFTLANSAPHGENLLTFPIVKKGTADSAENIPTGVGDYVITKTENSAVLVPSRGGVCGQIESITLVPVTDSGKLMYSIQTGEIDFFCSDLSGDKISRSGGIVSSVPRNNLLFMGINSDSYLLSFENVRKAVACAVNRDEIAESVYSGYAEASCVPIHPSTGMYSEIEDQISDGAVNYDKAAELLAEEGFSQAGSDGVLTGDKGTLRLTLLVGSESEYRTSAAACIAQSLEKAGFAVIIKSLAYDDYAKALESGSYDLYIGEVKLPDNGDLSVFFGGGASYGIAENSPSLLAYGELLSGAVSIQSFITTYENDVPFISLCFRNDVLVCSEKITVPENGACFSDCLCNTEKWTVKTDS